MNWMSLAPASGGRWGRGCEAEGGPGRRSSAFWPLALALDMRDRTVPSVSVRFFASKKLLWGSSSFLMIFLLYDSF